MKLSKIFPELTPTQCVVALHTIRGLGNDDIAAQTGASARTIASHQIAIWKRLGMPGGVRRDVMLLLLALSRGLDASEVLGEVRLPSPKTDVANAPGAE